MFLILCGIDELPTNHLVYATVFMCTFVVVSLLVAIISVLRTPIGVSEQIFVRSTAKHLTVKKARLIVIIFPQSIR